MAEPIKDIQFKVPDKEAQDAADFAEVKQVLIEHKEAILEILECVGHLHDRGILSLLNGLLGQGDQVLDILVKTANMPENKNTLKNILLLLGTIGMINVTQLEPILLKLNAGIARVSEREDLQEEEKLGYLDLARSLKDPEVNRSLSILLDFLKGMGTDVEHLEKNDPSGDISKVQTGETQEEKK